MADLDLPAGQPTSPPRAKATTARVGRKKGRVTSEKLKVAGRLHP